LETPTRRTAGTVTRCKKATAARAKSCGAWDTLRARRLPRDHREAQQPEQRVVSALLGTFHAAAEGKDLRASVLHHFDEWAQKLRAPIIAPGAKGRASLCVRFGCRSAAIR